ncbi:MAG: SpoIIE family protein phosphatase [Bacteroidetes bacterium]|nr:SpoIIE family protein phosphatase [Bacteroidota bacterium]
MNPVSKFKNFIIGDALLRTEDVFEQVKVQVLFSFTLFFLVLNIPYSIVSYLHSTFHFIFALSSTLALAAVFVVLKKVKDIKWAVYFYIFNHLTQNFTHFIINNGKIELQGLLFFLLIILFGFLMVNRTCGFSLLVMVIVMYFIGMYNTHTAYALFSVPAKYADPVNEQITSFLTVIPLLLNSFLVSQFVKAKQKAEQQIKEQKVKLESAYEEMTAQKHDIVSSINYAQKIQFAVLPREENIYRSIPSSFILYKPRDIVSGDFFWFHEIDANNYIIVCADCTGHGVPGAFMTVIGTSLLNQIVIENKTQSPAKILFELDHKITTTLKQEKEKTITVQDGMDLSLLSVNKLKKEVIITSAKRPVAFIRDKELQEFKGSKFSLGGMVIGEKVFEEIKIDYKEDDILYFYTDGYTDQFGGAKGKKFSSKRLREAFLEIHTLPITEQKQKLDSIMNTWRGKLEQVDDILVMGIKL